MAYENLTVQIMAGGKSTRMGQDKAGVLLDGRTLLDRALERWKDFGNGMQLSVGPGERSAMAPEGVRAVIDIYPERGPLGGLHAGLQACQTELLLLVAVDSPFVTEELAEALVNMSESSSADAYVYSLDGRPEPLFGLYRKSCLPAAEELLRAGENKMGLLLCRVDTAYLFGAGKQRFFLNLNTPEELAQAQSKTGKNCEK